MASIEVKGLDKVFTKLGNVSTLTVMEKPMYRAMYRLQIQMQEYPNPRPGQRYIRTGTYGRRWVTPPPARTANSIRGTIGNNTAYGPFVGSKRFQSRVHRGRWNTAEDVVARELPAIQADFQQEIDRALAGG